MAMFANGEEYKEIGYSNFASQRQDNALMRGVANHTANRVSDSLVGAPLSTGNLQPTAGHVGFTTGYRNATPLGKFLAVAAGVGVSGLVGGNILTRAAAGAVVFVGTTYLYDLVR